MHTQFFRQQKMIFAKHPKYDNVRMATFVTGADTKAASACLLEIAAGTEGPVHGSHEPASGSDFRGGGVRRGIRKRQVGGDRPGRLHLCPGHRGARHQETFAGPSQALRASQSAAAVSNRTGCGVLRTE